MSKLLIVASTEFEIEDFLTEHCKEISQTLFEVNNNKNIRILITGMGIANCTLNLSKYLSQQTPDSAINIGFCGSFTPELKLGSMLSVNIDCFAELGIANENSTITPFQTIIKNPKMLISLNACVKPKQKTEFGQITKVCRGVTVNSCTGTQQRADFFINNFMAETESMEGAAFVLTCNSYNIPCAQIRAVSNHIPGRQPERWDISKAKTSLQQFLSEIIL